MTPDQIILTISIIIFIFEFFALVYLRNKSDSVNSKIESNLERLDIANKDVIQNKTELEKEKNAFEKYKQEQLESLKKELSKLNSERQTFDRYYNQETLKLKEKNEYNYHESNRLKDLSNNLNKEKAEFETYRQNEIDILSNDRQQLLIDRQTFFSDADKCATKQQNLLQTEYSKIDVARKKLEKDNYSIEAEYHRIDTMRQELEQDRQSITAERNELLSIRNELTYEKEHLSFAKNNFEKYYRNAIGNSIISDYIKGTKIYTYIMSTPIMDQLRILNYFNDIDVNPDYDIIELNIYAKIKGSNNNIYTTNLNQCTCPDYIFHHKKPCKHMYRLAHELAMYNMLPSSEIDKEIKILKVEYERYMRLEKKLNGKTTRTKKTE